ncbi:MAG TPA: four helix bundle protein [Patescibacteria group bacterium]|nr:four helix bundle protein [Patescibacteria group bacterium]
MAFRFEELEIWKLAICYTNSIYSICKRFPKEELFSLQDQLKRCSSSIAANIAEGSGASSTKDFCHYLDISTKSVYESVSHLFIAKQQGYITKDQLGELYEDADKLARKIRSFKASLLRNA